MSALHVSKHPLVQHKLAAIRSLRTSPAEFRTLVRSLTTLLAAEAMTDLPTRDELVQTPLGPATSRVLEGKIALIPVLRAGLGMAEGVLDLVPEAEVWHVGLYRDEQTLKPMEYYNRLPRPCEAMAALVLDPMLATGGSAVRACEIVRASGIACVKFVGIIAAPEGVALLQEAQPDVPIHVAAVDQGLNENGFIVPGLGDAGDRQFGTLPH